MTVKHAHRPLRAAVLPMAIAGLMLAACSAQPIYPEAAGVEKVVGIDWRMERHPVRFGLGQTAPAPGEIAQLDSFVRPYVNDTAVRVYVDAAPGAAGADVADQRMQVLVAWLEEKGFDPRVMIAGIPGAVPATDPDRAVVYIGRYHAVLPDCPDWRKQTAADFTNTPSSNYGCATTVNFARMLADPGDVVLGRDPGPSDGDRIAGTIKAYREAPSRDAAAGAPTAISTTGGGGQ